jgi:hypothetical protein
MPEPEVTDDHLATRRKSVGRSSSNGGEYAFSSGIIGFEAVQDGGDVCHVIDDKI